MCFSCTIEADLYLGNDPKVLGKYFLVRATKDADFVKAGDWGLVIVDGPTFMFRTTPWPNPCYDMWATDTEDEFIESLPKSLDDEGFKWLEESQDFGAELLQSTSDLGGRLSDMADLVFACLDYGLPKEKTREMHQWLFQHIGELIASNPVPTHPYAESTLEKMKEK